MWSKRSPAPKNILKELAERDKTLSDLAESIKISKQAALKHLENLEDGGLVESRKEKRKTGQVKVFSLSDYTSLTAINSQGYIISFETGAPLYPSFPLVGQIPQKHIQEEVVSYLEEIDQLNIGPISMVLYGSVARGEATGKSDIDAILLSRDWSEEGKEKVQNKVADANIDREEIRRSLNVQFHTYEDIEEKTDFLEDVRTQGILVHTTRKEDPTWEILERYKSI